MAPQQGDFGSFIFAQELFEQGDPAFLTEIRQVTDADQLGNFAVPWYRDRRPFSRQMLLAYLELPLNAFRHEALVKRLFKIAEKAGDDEVMARFLVLFDRSLRRKQTKRMHHRSVSFALEAKAEEQKRHWEREGFDSVYIYRSSNSFRVSGWYSDDALIVPGSSTMWRPTGPRSRGSYPITKQALRSYERCTLFSLATRRYLRRRSWRYCRRLGKQNPERFVGAASVALVRYQDADVATGLALIDNWGLVHILFHHSPALQAKSKGWAPAPGRSLAELAPAPIYEALWKNAPGALLELVKSARCRPVRQWAIGMIRRDQEAVLKGLSHDELFALLAHDDSMVVSLAADVIRTMPDVSVLGVDRLVGLVDRSNAETLPIVCELLEARLGPTNVSPEQSVTLAISRPLPAARLGFGWLRAQVAAAPPANPTPLLGLLGAQSEPLRPEIVRWLRGVLSASPEFQPNWVLDHLDSRHEDVRREGWAWLQEEPRARDNVEIWQKLLESPYDEVRLHLVTALEKRLNQRKRPLADAEQMDPELVRFLWAAVLLNIHRGGRAKPIVVEQIVRRLNRHPGEAPLLLPILAAALRSVRGPEWRAGLVGVVGIVEAHPDLAGMVAETFPELKEISA